MSNIKVSVIIPVYNDPSGLRDTLNCLVRQNFPKDLFEIIVADNDSTDDTSSLIQSYIDKYPKFIRVLKEEAIQSSYAARNKGVKKAKGSIIAFIDADMTVSDNWLKKVLESFEDNKINYIGCKVETVIKKKVLSAFYNKMVAFPVEYYIRESHYAPTCCLVVRKEIFENVGLFDTRLISGGDREFGQRVYKAGYKIHYVPGIIMKHPARYPLKQILRKAFRIGRGYKQMNFYYPQRYKKKYKNILNPRNFLPKMSPFRFTKAMRGKKIWDEASCMQRILFFFIYWFSCLGNYFGYFYEGLFGIKKSRTK